MQNDFGRETQPGMMGCMCGEKKAREWFEELCGLDKTLIKAK